MSVALTFCKSQRGFAKSPAELQEKVGASVGDDTTIGPHISRELFFCAWLILYVFRKPLRSSIFYMGLTFFLFEARLVHS